MTNLMTDRGAVICGHGRQVSICAVCAPIADARIPQSITVNTITFTLPFCPPSVNSLYTVNYKEPDPSRRVTLKDECRRWKSEVHSRVPRFKIADDSVVRIDWTVYYPWLTKRKTWAKRDTANMLKLLHDVISERIGVDDRRFKAGMMFSVNSAVERTVVTLTEVSVSEWSAHV